MKDHTAKSFEPKYKEDYHVVQIYGTNTLQVSDKSGRLHNIHITDVKRVTMTEKVATQMEEIYNKGRTAKNLIPQGLLPDLGWKTDQQEEGRQPLPIEKTTETTVTQTTPNQVEGPQSSRLQSKTKQLKPSKPLYPLECNPAPVDPPNAIQEVYQVQTASRTGNRMYAVLP